MKTKLFLPPGNFDTDRVRLENNHLHYLRRVLRLRSGDSFVALDGEGRAWVCCLGSDAEAHRASDFAAVPPHPLSLTVGLALCKGARFEEALESLAELGVTRVIPIHTERTERKSPSAAKLERWKEIALSASALAGRLLPMRVTEPLPLTALSLEPAEALVCCHPGGQSPLELLTNKRQSLLVVIGPEGGLTEKELNSLETAPARLDLGQLNLRVATAAVVACGLALQLHGKGKSGPKSDQ